MSYLNNIFHKHFGIEKMVKNAVTNAAVAGLTGAATGAAMGSMNNTSPTDAVNQVNKTADVKLDAAKSSIDTHTKTIESKDPSVTESDKSLAKHELSKAKTEHSDLLKKYGESGSDARKAHLDKVAADQKSSNQKQLMDSVKRYSGMGAAAGAVSGAISGAQQDDDEFFSTKFKLMFSEYNKGVN